ncbi:CDP-glycerol glycerophosphotransferase family protein [Frateuria sp. MAH-13]|uniref:CDP-glycerol glycerophosphotransferase family protein n=1 Tax=Frateuria flava TaxID=2821489 RepID=A0ABS4DJ54_9GAMM|nr:CDP-glycerol glycerophosphotransferase family protein [Frateuria flava]MBP1473081.1 CDP-glycerol glycerophosphotransferase family protein [Frateuria flava]
MHTSEKRHYLLYGSERYALAILRPLQAAIRARGDEAAWFFDGPGAQDLDADERLLGVDEVRRWNPVAVLTPGNHLPHFFPGVKVEVFHGFDAGKPRHIYIRGFFDLYCTTGPRDTAQFQALADRLGHFSVAETGWTKLDPFLREIAGPVPPVRQPPVILYHSTFSPSWSAAETLYEEVRRLSRDGRWRWIVTFHPKMNPQTVAKYKALENEFLTFAENDNILELFTQVDMMCSDTSSALNEFLLTGKPVVTFRNRRPGPQLIDIDDPAQFEPAIERALARPPELMAAIQDYADAIHPCRDGHASERVLAAIDAFVASGGRNRKRKPLNLWRKFKLRRRIGYWGPARLPR